MYLSLAKETYQVKAALLDSGTIIDKAIKFVNNARGLTQRNNQLMIDKESTNQARTQQEDEQVEEQDNDNDTNQS